MNPEMHSKPNVDSSVVDLADSQLRLSEANFTNVERQQQGKIEESLTRRMLQVEEALSAPAADAYARISSMHQSIYMIVELSLGNTAVAPYKFATADQIAAAHEAIDQFIERHPGIRRVTNTRMDMPFMLRVEPKAFGAVNELAQLPEVARLS